MQKSDDAIIYLCNKIISSVEFENVFDKLFNLVTLNFFSVNDTNNILISEYKKLLKYSDFLSNSTVESHRTLALQIITLLYKLYFNDEGYQVHLKSIFSKFGLFGAEESFVKEELSLPDSLEYERNLKRLVQSINAGQDIFTDSQYKIHGGMSKNNVFSFSGPTSLGKSFLLKHSAIKMLNNNNIIVFILPTKALLEEYHNDLRKMLSIEGVMDVNVAKSVSSVKKGVKNILIFTQERLNSFLFDDDFNSVNIDVLIVDEAHKLSEFNPRSITLYKVIRRSIDKFSNLKLYFSSPVIHNPEIFLKTFNIDSDNKFITVKESPVTQSLYVYDLQENIVSSYNPRSKVFDKLKVVENITSSYSLISYLGNRSKSNLIFSSSKTDAILKASEFLNFVKREGLLWDVDKELSIEADIVKGLIHDDYNLSELMRHGIAYHHGTLPNFIRKRVEELYSNKRLKYIFCTSTLLEGVNLPTENIFIFPMKNKKSTLSVESKLSFWNLAGRAGRYKNELNGNIICLGNRNDWEIMGELVSNDREVSINNPLDETFSKHRKIRNILNDKTLDPHAVIKDVTSIVLADVMGFKRHGAMSSVLLSIPEKFRDNVIEEGWQYICRHGIRDINHLAYSSNHRISTEQHYKAWVYAKDKGYKLKSLSRDSVKDFINVLDEVYGIRKTKASLSQLINVTYSWLYGDSLRKIISDSIKYSKSVKDASYQYVTFEPCNKEHVNFKIMEVISTIENEVTFKLEMYCAHYFQVLLGVYGEHESGINLSPFLEYGTMDVKTIALQDYGFSRAAALEIEKQYSKCVRYDENGQISQLNKQMLLTMAGANSVVAKEVMWIV
ncbi:helicase domain protein [Shewanella halifaxensis HAW-EB4]|uniref:Helicase domain protein n=1 Tax=Shewanella halifaxensis (strain HAW-EB4) TaxID=458817 RepID=B0TLN3_SHEHH|nr:DEAD/DEAH box helicase [Shewanella halifaxensis]ABZ75983.1 helicase domain protein [Shewanella halifaxensis HAW-EB4]